MNVYARAQKPTYLKVASNDEQVDAIPAAFLA